MFPVIKQIYGIDYKAYICGGLGNAKIMYNGKRRELFETETDMLKRLAELKTSNCNDEFELFISKIIKEEYKL